jgi:hypothetical protein
MRPPRTGHGARDHRAQQRGPGSVARRRQPMTGRPTVLPEIDSPTSPTTRSNSSTPMSFFSLTQVSTMRPRRQCCHCTAPRSGSPYPEPLRGGRPCGYARLGRARRQIYPTFEIPRVAQHPLGVRVVIVQDHRAPSNTAVLKKSCWAPTDSVSLSCSRAGSCSP